MRKAFLLAMMGIILVPTFSAQAQDRTDADMSTRLGAKLMLGLGGEADYDDFDIRGFGFNPDVEDDMENTTGLGVSLEVPFHQYVTAGGLLAFHSWNSETVENFYDNFTLIDLSGFIKVRYPTHLGKLGFEPYVMLPLGLSVNIPDDDLQDDAEMETGSGWNIGLLFGAVLFVTDNVGLNLELGFTRHALHHEFDIAGEPDADIEIGQAAFNMGVVIALD